MRLSQIYVGANSGNIGHITNSLGGEREALIYAVGVPTTLIADPPRSRPMPWREMPELHDRRLSYDSRNCASLTVRSIIIQAYARPRQLQISPFNLIQPTAAFCLSCAPLTSKSLLSQRFVGFMCFRTKARRNLSADCYASDHDQFGHPMMIDLEKFPILAAILRKQKT